MTIIMREVQDMPHIVLRAFNLTPGATFVTSDPEQVSRLVPWVAVSVNRNPNREEVWAWARRGDLIPEAPGDTVPTKVFVFDYCDDVPVIGHVVNPGDPDDTDWGTD